MRQLRFGRTFLNRNDRGSKGVGWLVGAICIGLTSPAWSFDVGDSFPTQTFQDQHQHLLQIDADTESVYVVSSREQGDWMAEILADQPADYLSLRKAVYVADMSRMPGFVTSMFVLPALRQAVFSVAVVTDDALLVGWKKGDDAVVQYLLKNGEVVAIKRHPTIESLKESLGGN